MISNGIKHIFTLKNVLQQATMANKITFMMIKPEAVMNHQTGKIIDSILTAGFNLIALKMIFLTPEKASKFYEVHKDRPFYKGLIEFISSGPVVAGILEKENAVDDFRTLIGATNPSEAAEGTLRKLYGTSLQKNAIHGSDSEDNATKEAAFFFSEFERV